MPEQVSPDIQIAYDSDPWWYDLRGMAILWFAYRSTLLRQIRFFAAQLRENHLEVAIGSGSLFQLILLWTKLLYHSPQKITAFDYTPRMLAGAKKRFGRDQNIQLLVADVTHMPFPDQSFDSINIANAIHCFPQLPQSFKEIYRVLKPGHFMACNCLLYPKGPLARISQWINEWGQRKGILHRPYDQIEIVELLKQQGFVIHQQHRHGNCLYLIARRPL